MIILMNCFFGVENGAPLLGLAKSIPGILMALKKYFFPALGSQ